MEQIRPLMNPVIKHMSKIILFAIYCIVCTGAKLIAQRNYYVSASGSDSNDGAAPQAAWRSPAKINTIDFNPGDSLFFEGGNTFTGTIKLGSEDNGSKDKPVVFTSYGRGRATINAGDGDGLFAINTSFIKLN